MKPKLLALPLLMAALLLCCPAHAGEDAPQADDGRAAMAAWDKFVSLLRVGKMREAYGCFSERSRSGMPFEDFCTQYSPMSAINEAILAAPEESRFQFSGEKAILRYIAVPREAGAPGVLVQAFLAREPEGWRLITSASWEKEAAEADVRALMRRCQVLLAELAATGKLPISFDVFLASTPQLAEAPAMKLVRGAYDFTLMPSSKAAWKLEAKPRQAEGGLRAFVINERGDISVSAPAAEPAKAQDKPAASAPKQDGDETASSGKENN